MLTSSQCWWCDRDCCKLTRVELKVFRYFNMASKLWERILIQEIFNWILLSTPSLILVCKQFFFSAVLSPIWNWRQTLNLKDNLPDPTRMRGEILFAKLSIWKLSPSELAYTLLPFLYWHFIADLMDTDRYRAGLLADTYGSRWNTVTATATAGDTAGLIHFRVARPNAR